MYKMKWVTFILLLAPVLAIKDYTGYQVLRIVPLLDHHVQVLQTYGSISGVDFWRSPRVGYPADVMIPPHLLHNFSAQLQQLGLETTVLFEDVETQVRNEQTEIERKRKVQKSGRAPAFDRYLTFEEIQEYLDIVVSTYPTIATLTEIGTSTEGRPLRVLKLSSGPAKTGIWFESVIHAREWIGPPTVLYAINQLTENLAENQAMLDANDFYFLPVANPDGYSFTWTDDRFWRKTRNVNVGSTCMGTDPNRNFDFQWGGGGVGSFCDETYAGTSPYSASETREMTNFLTANVNITFYVAVHSAGPLLLYPWGTTNDLPPNVQDLEDVGNAAASAIASIRGTEYTVGSTANALYFAYGISTDTMYSTLCTPMSFTIELPPGGSGWFDPPPTEIEPVSIETWEAYKVFAQNIPQERMPVKN